MRMDHKEVMQKLAGIVVGVSRDPAWREELIQEGLIHLWQAELHEPGHTQSWYLQSCSFYLRKLLLSGRSLDSPKRTARREALPAEDGEEIGTGFPEPPAAESPLETICVRDFVAQISRRLPPVDGRILRWLTEGNSVSEIARKLRVSHTCVAAHRRLIRRVATRLGLAPHGSEAPVGKNA